MFSDTDSRFVVETVAVMVGLSELFLVVVFGDTLAFLFRSLGGQAWNGFLTKVLVRVLELLV